MNINIAKNLSMKICIFIAGCNAVTSWLMLYMDYELAIVKYVPVLSFAVFIVLVINKRTNILFFARTLFLGVIGYFPMLVKVVYGANVDFSVYERSTQSIDIVILMFVATSLALFGNEIGLYLGSRTRHAVRPCNPAHEKNMWVTIFYFSIPLVLWASYETAKAAGPSIFEATYSSGANDLPMGNIVAIGAICILAMFVAFRKTNIKYGEFFFIPLVVFFLVYAQFTRGLRQDVMTTFLGLIVCSALIKNRSYVIGFWSFIISFLTIGVFEIWGLARISIAERGVNLGDTFNELIKNYLSYSDAIQFGTVSPIATTFSNTVWLIETGRLDYALGRTYLEFIPRTPPAFLYPDRPGDYAWMFQDYGLVAGGGFFELAEAYMNLGLIGTLIFPAFISYLLSKTFFNVLNRQTVFSYFLLFSFLAVFLRGTWYQTFAFYKCFWTVLVLYFFFWLLCEIIYNKKNRIADI